MTISSKKQWYPYIISKKEDKCNLFTNNPFSNKKLLRPRHECQSCKTIHENEETHDYIMKIKCVNIKNNNCYSPVITNLIKKYPINTIIDDSLAKKLIKGKIPNSVYLTSNHLFIQCPICRDDNKRVAFIQPCGHCLCRECLNNFVLTHKMEDYSFNCLICRNDPTHQSLPSLIDL